MTDNTSRADAPAVFEPGEEVIFTTTPPTRARIVRVGDRSPSHVIYLVEIVLMDGPDSGAKRTCRSDGLRRP